MTNILSTITRTMAQARETGSSDDFLSVSSILKDNETAVRERIQELTSGEMEGIVTKIKGDQQLSEKELNYVRLWIVGDAINYRRVEKDYQSWLAEFSRLEQTFREYELKDTLNMEDLFLLQGLIEDTARLVPGMANYREKLERIARFEESVQDNVAHKEVLIDILTAKLTSPDC